MLEHLWLIPTLPLAGAALVGLAGRKWSHGRASVVGVSSVGLSFLVALVVAWEFQRLGPEQIPFIRSYFTWIQAGTFRADYQLYLDQLSLLMTLVVAGVGFIIHVYSIGYMAHEGGSYRFFAYLNLFMFFMLTLVLAGNYLLLFVGWEGVGLCSYLLIGFYFLRKSAADAGKKAFIVNRIGDFGFTLALMLAFWTFGSLDYTQVFASAAKMPVESSAQMGVLTAITLLLLAGATGKSAQVPLYVWLPDAMEGPTPVSALIHAATMVAAGVYMVARSHVLFMHAPLAMGAVAAIGCITAFYAASIGLVQTDIKRILAYSTISQLGYMFLGCGVGAFAAGMFHLMTHAYFKALLFLAAGSVIHVLSGEQDIRSMGGLWPRIKLTAVTFWAGTLAIAGAPGFSGFFSKDEILWQAYSSPYGNKFLWALGLLAALMTSFYMFRLLFLTFHGAPRYSAEVGQHIQESPPLMTWSLAVLAFLSLVGGYVGVPAALGERLGVSNWLEHWLEPVFAPSTAMVQAAAVEHAPGQELALMGLAIIVAFAGFLIAYVFYLRQPQLPDALAERFHFAYRPLLNKYYVDEIYAAVIVRPLEWLSTRVLWQLLDVAVIDGAVNGLADRARALGNRVRYMQSGNTRSYAAWVVLGAVLVITFMVGMVR